ncbi:MAG: thioredoxin family protein [Chitinophagales bacterium]
MIRRHTPSAFFAALSLSLLFVSTFSFASNDEGINFFEGSLSEAQSIAAEEQRPVFVQLSADWCLPCRQMEKNVFPLNTVGEFYNQNFINIKLDADSPDGIELKRNYDAMTIPESFFFDSNGRLMLREGGFKGEQQILTLGNKILKKHPKPRKPRVVITSPKSTKTNNTNTSKDTSTKGKNYGAKPSNSSKLYSHKSAFDLFLMRLTGSIKKPHNMEWVYYNAENFDSKAMNTLLRQKRRFNDYYGKSAINQHIKSILYTKLAIATGDKNEDLYKEILKVVQKADLPESDFLKIELQSRYFEGIGDNESYVKVNRQFMRSYKGKDPAVFHRKAWEVHNHSDNKADLLKAIDWLEKSVDLNPQFYNLETLAKFYDKTGKKRKARKAAQQAIEYAKMEGRSFNHLLKLVN